MTRTYCDRCKAEIRVSDQAEWVRLPALWSHSRVRVKVEADPVEIAGGRIDLCDACFCTTLVEVAAGIRALSGA